MPSIGDLVHRGEPIPGVHEPLVEEKLWRKAQAVYASSARRQATSRHAAWPAMLKGLLFGPTGHVMVHHSARGRNGQIYRYYVSTLVNRYGPGSCPLGRFRAAEIEAAVSDRIVAVSCVSLSSASICMRAACKSR